MNESDWDAVLFESAQLFTPSQPLNENDLFAGRIEQIKRLLGAVAEPGKHAMLFGEAGVGKTSLGKLLAGFFPPTNRNVFYIREQLDPTDTFSSIWKKVFKDIHVEIERNGRPAVDTVASFYNGEITPDDVRREFTALFGPADVPVIVIDEFNKLESSETKVLVANTLKSLSDFGVNVTIIVVGVADNVSELVAGHTSLPRCIEQVSMRRMDEAERREVLDKRIPRLGMTIVDEAIARIVQLSRGLPSYVHALGLYAIESAIQDRRLEITEKDVDFALKRTIEKSSESIQDDYAEAIQSNRKDGLHREVLLACALAETDDRGYFTPLSVCKPLTRVLKRGKKIVPISTFQGHLKKFITSERASVLDRRGRERAYRFRFTDPMMQPFVIMKGIESGDVTTEVIDALSSTILS